MASEVSTRLGGLRFRVALAFVGLLSVALAVFSWGAYDAARRSTVAASTERLESVTTQLARLLADDVEAFAPEARRLANDARLEAVLTGASFDGARSLLDSVARTVETLRALQLRGAGGEVLLTAGDAREVPPDDTTPAIPREDSVVVGPFYRHGTGIGFTIATGVSGPAGEQGVLVYHLGVAGSPEAGGGVSGLIGDRASLALGTPGGVWTDLAGEVPGPPTGLDEPGTAEVFVTPDGDRAWGAGARVPGTPWIVRVAFPEGAVLRPARELLAKMIPFGLIVVALGGLAGLALAHGLTRRLDRLADAAAAIAAGDYGRRVELGGSDELTRVGSAFDSMAQQVQTVHDRLEERVATRTAQLEAANEELESFSYSVSHDLRAPLRAVHGFSRAVLEDHGDGLPPAAKADLQRVCAGAERMGRLIDDLLELSRATRVEIRRERVDLGHLARRIVDDLKASSEGRVVDIRIADGLEAHADPSLIELALRNLLHNAWKFTSRRSRATIEVGRSLDGEAFFVRDDGAGFDPTYRDKLFEPFQRLHSERDFPGTGVGLALVARILHRHGGEVWAEGEEGRGATFFFTLPETA